MLPKTKGYVKRYDGQTKLLEKCSTIWGKVSADIKRKFDSGPVYNKEYIHKYIYSC